MKFLSQEETKRITDKVLSLSKADECSVTVNGSRQGNIRYARNAVSTAGLAKTPTGGAVAFGKKQGTATINEFDDKSLEKAVRRAEDLARLAPENPEFMPAVAKQEYKRTQTFSKKTADIDPEFRAQVAAYSIEACRKNKLVAAGFFTDSTSSPPSPIRTACSATRRTPASTSPAPCAPKTAAVRAGSSAATDVSKFDAREAADVAIEKALRSVDAKALEPGRYTVILEPAATSDVLASCCSTASTPARPTKAAASCRKRAAVTAWVKSCSTSRSMSGPIRGTRTCRCCRGMARPCWRASAGHHQGRQGRQPDYSQFWAKKQGKRAVGSPGNIIMAGTNKSTEN
jgi:hypothetical protein